MTPVKPTEKLSNVLYEKLYYLTHIYGIELHFCGMRVPLIP